MLSINSLLPAELDVAAISIPIVQDDMKAASSGMESIESFYERDDIGNCWLAPDPRNQVTQMKVAAPRVTYRLDTFAVPPFWPLTHFIASMSQITQPGELLSIPWLHICP